MEAIKLELQSEPFSVQVTLWSFTPMAAAQETDRAAHGGASGCTGDATTHCENMCTCYNEHVLNSS